MRFSYVTNGIASRAGGRRDGGREVVASWTRKQRMARGRWQAGGAKKLESIESIGRTMYRGKEREMNSPVSARIITVGPTGRSDRRATKSIDKRHVNKCVAWFSTTWKQRGFEIEMKYSTIRDSFAK